MRFRGFEIGHQPDPVAASEVLAALGSPSLGLVVDALPDGVMALDSAGVVVLYNLAAESIHDVPRERALGARLAELAEDSSLDCASLADAYHNNRRSDLFAATASGRAILVSVRPVRDRRRDTMLTLVVLRDLDVLDHQREAGRTTPETERFRFRGATPVAARPDGSLLLSAGLERAVGHGVRALERRARVLVTGETGVGKTEIAKHIHRAVCGDGRPFIHVNCGSVPESLFESEMFGYERGAFTGALQGGRKGLIEAAGGGTLFLDEVGEIPRQSQAKLLKFLEDGTVQRVGAGAARRVDVRVIAATNRDLAAMVRNGGFRRDLYHRLRVVEIGVPPLRSQPELIEPLLQRMLERINRERTPPLRLDSACRARILAHDFPGNVRELANIVERLAVVADDVAGLDDLAEDLEALVAIEDGEDACARMSLKDRVRAYEYGLIDEAVRRHGSKRKAARALGVDIGTIVRKTQGSARR